MKSVSVIIPSVARVESLKRALGSLSLSSILPKEIIIVEQKNSKKVEKELQGLFSNLNLKILSVHFLSLTKAKNFGAKNASSDFLLFIDDDIELDKDYIKTALEFMSSHKNALLLTGQYKKERKKCDFLKLLASLFRVLSCKGENIILPSGFYDYIRAKNLDKTQNIEWAFGCNMFVKKELFDEFKFYEDFERWSFTEDAMFSYEIYKKYPDSIYYLPELKLKHTNEQSGKLLQEQALRMRVVYRYIFWRRLVYDGISSFLQYLWAQVGNILLELYQYPGWKTIKNLFFSYIFISYYKEALISQPKLYNKFIFSGKTQISFWGKYPLVRIKQIVSNPASLYFLLKRILFLKKSSLKLKYKYEKIKILNPKETLEHAIKNKKSIVRFGDGEYGQFLGLGEFPPNSDWSQRFSKKLKKEMEKVAKTNKNNILICHLDPRKIFSEPLSMHTESRLMMHKLIDKNKIYGNSDVFSHLEKEDLQKIKEFLSDKNVVIVTGDTNSFPNLEFGKEIFYVETGKKDAFERLEKIKEEIQKLIKKEKLQKEDTIFMISLGPSAGILALWLSELGFLAWDTGHFFLSLNEYENL